MKAMNMNEAWKLADEIFPTDYMKDDMSSERAGYPVYRSTAEGHYYDYICDLGDRLEVNMSNGKSINIWVEDDEPSTVTESEVQQMIADNNAAKAAGAHGWMNIAPQAATVYNFCVMHTDYYSDSADHAMAEALNRSDDFMQACLIGEYVAAWCDANGILWGSIEQVGKADKYEHASKDNYHYIFRVLVTERKKD